MHLFVPFGLVEGHVDALLEPFVESCSYMTVLLAVSAYEDLLEGQVLCLWINFGDDLSQNYLHRGRLVSAIAGPVHGSLMDLVYSHTHRGGTVAFQSELGHSPLARFVLVYQKVVLLIL